MDDSNTGTANTGLGSSGKRPEYFRNNNHSTLTKISALAKAQSSKKTSLINVTRLQQDLAKCTTIPAVLSIEYVQDLQDRFYKHLCDNDDIPEVQCEFSHKRRRFPRVEWFQLGCFFVRVVEHVWKNYAEFAEAPAQYGSSIYHPIAHFFLRYAMLCFKGGSLDYPEFHQLQMDEWLKSQRPGSGQALYNLKLARRAERHALQNLLEGCDFEDRRHDGLIDRPC
jgi:hypothetical protein